MCAQRSPPNSKKDLYDGAFKYLERAEKERSLNNDESTKSFYMEACHNLIQVMHIEDRVKEKKWVKSKIKELLSEIETLSLSKPSAPPACELPDDNEIVSSADEIAIADFHYDQGLSMENSGRHKEAKGMFKVAADLYLKVLERGNISPKDKAVYEERVRELLKRMKDAGARVEAPTSDAARVRQGYLSKAETKVLMATSRINTVMCYPFLDEDAVLERYTFSKPFTDPDGLVPLSDKQREQFGGWRRPHQIANNCRMIDVISPYSIKQTLITDCSFISALAVTAHFERAFRTQLVTSVIYPQNSLGQPVYNPSGKYMIKLVLNGVARKVIIDDLLPVDRSGNLICSFSNNPGELWVSLIEKAFLKVHGGYAFPGSNGGVDLHILTGWIPERMSMTDKEFNKERTWERMVSAIQYGDCLITASTGTMDENLEESVGLVSNHAYAVLRVESFGEHRLLQLKNPWSRVRWKGRFSPEDVGSWTPSLRKHLGYDQMSALRFDNGVFWIDYESFLQYYHAVYLNWSPNLFSYRCTTHSLWPKNRGPKVDTLNREFCPQYRLVVDTPADQKESSVWILLSKHSIAKKQLEDEYITVHVYKDNGQRVYYPDEPFIRGTYINNPHHLTRFESPPGRSTYIIVVSQYEKLDDFSFTLNVYSTAAIQMVEIPDAFPHKTTIKGAWDASTACGSVNQREAFLGNPQYAIQTSVPQSIIIKLAGPKQFSLNVMAYRVMYRTADGTMVHGRLQTLYTSSSSDDMLVSKVGDTGAYRSGFCYCVIPQEALTKPPKGDKGSSLMATHPFYQFPMTITIVLSTFDSGQVGPFVLTVAGSKTNVKVDTL